MLFSSCGTKPKAATSSPQIAAHQYHCSKAWGWGARVPCPANQPNKQHRNASLLFSSCGTKTESIIAITTNSGASTSLPKLESGFESRGVRMYLVPRINPRSSAETPVCWSQVAGPNLKHENHHHKKRRINITPKLGAGFESRVVRVYNVPRINPKQHRNASLLFSSCGTKTESMKLITTNSGASTSHPKLGAGFESRGVRVYLAPRINPISSTETPACCSQVAGPNRKHENHHHKSGASTSLPKLGAGFESRGVRVYLVPRINPISSTRTPACCSQVAGPNRKHEHHHHK